MVLFRVKQNFAKVPLPLRQSFLPGDSLPMHTILLKHAAPLYFYERVRERCHGNQPYVRYKKGVNYSPILFCRLFFQESFAP